VNKGEAKKAYCDKCYEKVSKEYAKEEEENNSGGKK